MSYGQKLLTSDITGKNFFFELKPIEAWRAIVGWGLAIAIGLLIGGPIAIVTFPLGSLAVGWYLYRRYPLFYASFTWWLWFVSNLIRRIIDFRCGYSTVGPLHLSAILVTSISILTLLKYLPKAHKLGGMPFVLAAVSTIYAFLIHLITEGFTDFDNAFGATMLGWFSPIAFGFHLLIHWRDYPNYRQNIQRTFLWGLSFMGFYGIVQYVFAPPWDTMWLEASNEVATIPSFGTPEPFGIRVWSSMSAPQDFASVMGAGLVLLYCLRGSQQLWVNGLGYLSFLLTQARSGWLSWLFSILIFFRNLKSDLKIRMAIGIVMTILIILPVITIEPFSTVIGERVATLNNTDSDGSLTVRVKAFNLMLGHASTTLVGYGLKSPLTPDIVVRKDYIIGDNGVIVILFALGWIGAGPYVVGIILSIFQIRQTCLKNNDLVLDASYAIILGHLSQVLFKNIFVGAFAMCLWGFIGIGMSARNYYLSQRISEKSL